MLGLARLTDTLIQNSQQEITARAVLMRRRHDLTITGMGFRYFRFPPEAVVL
jgi:hypothetical protein